MNGLVHLSHRDCPCQQYWELPPLSRFAFTSCLIIETSLIARSHPKKPEELLGDTFKPQMLAGSKVTLASDITQPTTLLTDSDTTTAFFAPDQKIQVFVHNHLSMEKRGKGLCITVCTIMVLHFLAV